MDFELKNFEEKINDITEQFMSLLDSNNAIEKKVTDKFENTAINFEEKLEAPQTRGGYEVNSDYSNNFKFDVDGIQNSKIGGIAFEDTNATPAHAISFADVNNDDLNKRLEELFNDKKGYYAPTEHASIAFSDSNLVAMNNNSYNANNYTNEKTNSENEKEGYNMANYGFTEGDDNSIFSFATVPQERALEPKRSFSDVLFMDIPWDTKIDVWGGIKSLFTTEVRFTF